MSVTYLERYDGPRLAYQTQAGATPGVLFLCGLKSDMRGTKAEFLAASCAARGQAFTRFDYRGHGGSSGEFSASLLSEWLADSLAIFDEITQGEIIIVGSSLGGWLGLLLAERRRTRVRGLIGIAAAPDFSRELTPARPFIEVPSAYADETFLLHPKFIDDAEPLCWFGRAHELACPVRLLQGRLDAEVPWQTAANIQMSLPRADCRIHLIADGDHRLSRPADLELLDAAVRELSA